MPKTKRLISLLLAIMLVLSVPVTVLGASKPSKPVLYTPTVTTSSVTLKWKKVSSATGYTVYRYNSGTKKYSKIASTKNTSYKISKLSAGTTYTYAVKTYKTVKKKTYYSDYSKKLTVSTLPTAPKNLKQSSLVLSGDKVSVTLSWSKVKNAKGYKLQYSTSSSFKSNVKTVSTTSLSKKISSLVAGKKYYFRVMSYRTVSNKNYNSSYSSYISIKLPDPYSDTLSVIDENTTYQTIEGFGASGAWWAQRIGRWTADGLTQLDDNEKVWTREQTENVLKYLYDEDEGIGLNIYRYNIGTDSYLDDGITNKWERTEGFIESIDNLGNITYDFSKDASAQNTLSVVKKLAGDKLKVSLFANSPPTQITDNGKAFCDNNPDEDLLSKRYSSKISDKMKFYNGVNTNLSEDKYELYADFLCDVADYFVEQGYNVKDVSPVNEPQYEWACNSEGKTSQEGCHYTPNGVAELLAVCALKGEEKSYKFSACDSCAADGGNDSLYIYTNAIFNSSKTKYIEYNGEKISIGKTNNQYYDTFSVHSYWSDKQRKQETANYIEKSLEGLKFACTEYCQMTNDTTTGVYDISSPIEWWDPARNGLEIEYGVQLARTITEDLTILNATEWNWWTACSGGYYPDGLVYVNYENPDDIQLSKRLWAMGNFSKFIKEGAVRVKITEVQENLISSAYKNKDGSLVVVYVNQTEKDYSTNIKADGYKEFISYITSENENLDKSQSGSFSLSSSINIPSQSVVTVVLK